jgi:hypothetical protein
MNSKTSENITIAKIFDGYKKDFSSRNVLKIISKNRLKFLIFIIVIVLLIFYEGINYIFDFTGRQAKRISDKIIESISTFAKEDLIKIYDKLSVHDGTGFKNFITGISEAIKNGESITKNFLEIKKLKPVETRTAQEVEQARNNFIDKLSNIFDDKINKIDSYKDVSGKIIKIAEAYYGIKVPKNEENLYKCNDKYNNDINNVIEHINRNSDKLLHYKDITNDKIKDECVMKVINILFKCYEIKHMSPRSDTKHVFSSWYDFSLNLLGKILESSTPLVADIKDNTITLTIDKYGTDITYKLVQHSFGKKKKRTSSKRTSKKRHSRN